VNLNKKFQNRLTCICNKHVFFEIIENVECDWGVHFIIQCPKCEELFSADCECPAFGSILNLLQHNNLLYSESEKSYYIENSHPK